MDHPKELVQAVVLHAKPYRENSALCEFITEHYGRLSAVVKGVRSKKSNKKALIQPFYGVSIMWRGKSDLKTLSRIEACNHLSVELQGKSTLCGFYVNELLIRLLNHYDPHPYLYQCYLGCIKSLALGENLEIPLRLFEGRLLQELGYAPDWKFHSLSSERLLADQYYQYDPQQGIVDCVAGGNASAAEFRYLGASLIAIAEEDYRSPQVLKDAKRLMRQALAPHLGNRALETRKLFL